MGNLPSDEGMKLTDLHPRDAASTSCNMVSLRSIGVGHGIKSGVGSQGGS